MSIVKIQRPIEGSALLAGFGKSMRIKDENKKSYAINLDIALIHDNIKFQDPNARGK